MLKKNNLMAKNKVILNYIKIVGVFLFVVMFAFTFRAMSVLADFSPSVGGHYNGYNEPDDDFDWGFDDDCDCDDNDDNDDDEPDATTRSASSVGDTNATLNGRVDGNGSSTRVWFEYGRDRDLDDETSQRSIGSGTDTVSIRISGLRRDTTYYFRVAARNNHGTDYGSIMSFHTDEDDNNNDNDEVDVGALITRTSVATFVSNNSAQLNSLITYSENDRVDAWFEWGTSPTFGRTTEKVRVDASPSVTHRAVLVGLIPGETYYFRAVAESADWKSNGSVFSFITTGGSTPTPPTINPPTPSAPTGGTTEEAPDTSAEENTSEEEAGTEGVRSSLEANVLGFGFFPTTLLGWLAFVIFILILYILGRKYLFPSTHHVVAVETHGHH